MMRIKIAIVYDFDGTLAEGNIQENSFIPELGMSIDSFWSETLKITKKNQMDGTLAYMYFLLKKAKEKGIKLDKKSFKRHGSSVKYFKGIPDYFRRINQYGNNKNIDVKHYIVSSGNKEMLEGTSIANEFEEIYASSFLYENDIPVWPSQAINYTNKVQYLFRINKGIDNIWDNHRVNKKIPKSTRPIPFENMIYIGDGETDIPAMKMIDYKGGLSIAVHPPNKKNITNKLVNEGRAKYGVTANYENNSELDKIIKNFIDGVR